MPSSGSFDAKNACFAFVAQPKHPKNMHVYRTLPLVIYGNYQL
jgi:hypothetical protein